MPEAILTAAALDASVRITLPPAPGMVMLRGDLAGAPLAAAVRAATGLDLPGCRRIVTGGGHVVAWMSPDELLLLTPPGGGAGLAAALEAALAGEHHLAVDVSAARRRFRIAGPGAREVLAKGAPVDLAPAAFGAGDLRRTRLGQVAVAFWAPDAQSFELVCGRSVGDFVARWLVTAAAPGSLPGYLRGEGGASG